jgi:ribosomal protein S18 acetylase RimI-like enzyme/catechol 2,3-dioxygenase-like lactoylglutathione lyase family enzyme
MDPAYSLRQAREDDYPAISAALQSWWTQPGLSAAGARERAALVPRLWLQHFSTTSLVAEQGGGVIGFLVAFFSADRPDEGYIHFVGVAPDARRRGIGRGLYEGFFELCRRAGRTRVRCITSPQNALSIAFHEAMEFEVEPGGQGPGPVLAKADYDGPGVHRIAFVRGVAPGDAPGRPPARGFVGIDHVQLAAPAGCEPEARRFFGTILGLIEVPKPPVLAVRGGAWFQCGAAQIHVGIEGDFRPAKKAHPAFRLADETSLDDLARQLAAAGVLVREDAELRDTARFFADDPWGNRLEFAAPRANGGRPPAGR